MDLVNNLDLDGKIKIVQNSKMNNFTMDSILLADFLKIKKKDNLIVDLCAGNIPVGMLMTLKKKDIQVSCVEIQKENCVLAEKSIKLNKLQDKVFIFNENLVNISEKIGKNKYDIVTFNPPYFRVDSTSNLNKNEKYTVARHEISVTLEEIIIESKKLLKNTGMIYFVHRPERLDEIIILLDKYNFEIKNLRFVHPFVDKEANVLLVEARKGKSTNNKVKISKPLYIYKVKGEYTDEMLNIMRF